MSEDKKNQIYYSFSLDEENYIGAFVTREEAMTEAFNYDPDARRCWTGENRIPARIVDADCVIEQVSISTTEESGDWADGYMADDMVPTREQVAELQAMLQTAWDEWEDKYSLQPTFWNVDRVQEHARTGGGAQ